MKLVTKTSVLLLIIVIISFFGCNAGNSDSAGTPTQPQSQIDTDISQNTVPDVTKPDIKNSVNRVDIIYFHPKTRCAACISVELRTKEVIDKYFKHYIDDNQLSFQSYELYNKQNEEIMKKFGAIGSQLFINTIVENEETIKHVHEVWMPDILNDQITFEEFMSGLISQELEKIN